VKAEFKSVTTAAAPSAIGPYSQAVRFGQFLFVSGQIPLEPSTGELVRDSGSDGIAAQTHRALQNLKAILEAANGSLADVIRTTVFLVDLDDFKSMNSVYATYFDLTEPARSTVQVVALPKGARIEIDAIAIIH
tara:strand:+ start:166 stop:567 length:402 start_codon:yes stop_codon:yes gene_type:complete